MNCSEPESTATTTTTTTTMMMMMMKGLMMIEAGAEVGVVTEVVLEEEDFVARPAEHEAAADNHQRLENVALRSLELRTRI